MAAPTTTKVDTTNCPKLNGDNYMEWKLHIELALEAADLKEVVDGTSTLPPTDAAKIAAWKKQDARARFLIVSVLQNTQIALIQNCATAKEMWDKLTTAHHDTSQFTKNIIYNEFYSLKVKPNEPLVDAFARAERHVAALTGMGETISEAAVVARIMAALPEKFNHLKAAWDSVPAASQTMNNLLQRLKKEDVYQAQNEDKPADKHKARAFAANNDRQGASTNYTNQRREAIEKLKKTTKCHNCNQNGHWRRECQKPLRQRDHQQANRDENKGQQKPQEAKAFMANIQCTGTDEEDIFYLDSGCTQNMAGRNDILIDYQPLITPPLISLANNGVIAPLGKGNVRVTANINGNWEDRLIKDVYYVPGMKNLFSASCMVNKGYSVVYNNTGAIFYDQQNERGPSATFQGNMFIMDFKPLCRNYALAASSKEVDMSLLHRRLCHINPKYIMNTINSNAVRGLKVKPTNLNDFVCLDGCLQGRQTRQPYPKVIEKRQMKAGQMAHADLAGPYVKSLGGAIYFLLLKDQHCGFRAVYFLKNKTEVVASVKDYIAMMETQTGNKFKVFRSDQGTEYTKLNDYFAEKGIIHELSTAYSPEQNGAIEREIRTLKDHARSCILGTDLPVSLWGEAIGHTVFIHNRILDKQSVDKKTAHETIFNVKPYLGNAHVFGCAAFAHVADQKRTSWDPKSTELVLVGYANSRNYRLYNKAKGTIEIHRNVIFREDYKEFAKIKITSTVSSIPEAIPESDEEDSESAESQPEIKVEERVSSDGENCSNASGEENQNQLEFFLDTPSANYQVSAPSDSVSTFSIPEASGVSANFEVTPQRSLRDRFSLSKIKRLQVGSEDKKSKKYHANVAHLGDEPRSYEEAMASPEAPQWNQACLREINSHDINGTWVLVPEEEANGNIIKSRWVFIKKRDVDGNIERYKARLVGKGFSQRPDIDFDPKATYTSVMRYATIRLLLAIIAIENLQFAQIDFETAFLNAVLKEKVYMEQPEGFVKTGDTKLVCKLVKSLYGLKQAPRCWSDTLRTFLETLGFRPTSCDPCIFVGSVDNEKVYLAFFVDDGLLACKSMATIKKLISQLGQKFKLTEGKGELFVGMELNRDANGDITVTQRSFINSLLDKFNMSDAKGANVPMQTSVVFQENEDKKPDLRYTYQELIGALLYLATVLRLDIQFVVNWLSRYMTCWTQEHWEAAKYVLRYLITTKDLGLKYVANGECVLVGYCDSDYAGDRESRKSTSGYLFQIGDGTISFSSHRQSVVALSSTEAEYISLSEAVKEAIYQRRLLGELGHKQLRPTVIYVDNQSAIKLALNSEFHKRTKHIQVKYHFTREAIENGEVELRYIPTNEQRADILTKPLQRLKHAEMRCLAGMATLSPRKKIEDVEAEEVKTEIKHRSSNWKSTALALLQLTFLFSFVSQSDSFLINPVPPIVWRTSEKPVTNGYSEVQLALKMTSPCDLLTTEIIHRDLVNVTKSKCDRLYEELFLDEMERLCPIKTPTSSIVERQKRFVIVGIGLILVGIIAVVGIAAKSMSKAYHNEQKIKRLINRDDILDKQLWRIQNRFDLAQESMQALQDGVGKLVKDVALLEKDYMEFKEKSPDTMFIISYIMSRLMLGKQIIRDTKRDWDADKMHVQFLEYFNFTLPCKRKCPPELAKPVSCQMNEERDQIILKYNAPHINNTIHVLKSDSFKMMIRTSSNKTCSIVYNGPQTVVFSDKQNCIFPLHTRYMADNDLVLIPNSGCKPGKLLPNTTKYFAPEFCVPRHENDAEDFIQVKHYHNANYVYCPESQITIEGRQIQCPSEPFRVPLSKEFQINQLVYTADKMFVQHTAKSDPILSFRANWDLAPSLHLKEIAKEIEKSESLLKQADLFRNEFGSGDGLQFTHVISYSTLIISILIGSGLAAIYYFRKTNKKKRKRPAIVKIKARKVPTDENNDEEVIELRETA